MSHRLVVSEMLGRGVDPAQVILIEENELDELEGFIDRRAPKSDFIKAILANDLLGAVMSSTKDNVLTLSAIVAFLRLKVPDSSWGSPEAVAVWLGEAVPEGSKHGAGVDDFGGAAIDGLVAVGDELKRIATEMKPGDTRIKMVQSLQEIVKQGLAKALPVMLDEKDKARLASEPIGETVS